MITFVTFLCQCVIGHNDMSDFIKNEKDCPDIITDKTKLSVISDKTTVEQCDKIHIWDKLSNSLLKSKNGVGLAAVQIGYPICAALAVLEKNGKQYQHKLLNPVIVNQSEEMVKFRKEGCLSFPGEYINTLRHSWVEVLDDINGKVVYSGFEGIVVQHEIDHMNGKTIHDRCIGEPFVRSENKIGRNDKCPCGSGKKYKKCCGV